MADPYPAVTFRERPILFSGPMVRAILEDRKTQTRRVVKPQPTFEKGYWCSRGHVWKNQVGARSVQSSPYGVPGDRLWVRETWGLLYPQYADDLTYEPTFYRADYTEVELREQILPRWKPSIHIPRARCRISLEITDVRVQRLHEVSEDDAKAEGIDDPLCVEVATLATGCATYSYAAAFGHLWDSINGKRPGCAWSDNPWVWAVTFKRVTP